eukprot:8197180-Pyramimonas_sp.AAC.1
MLRCGGGAAQSRLCESNAAPDRAGHERKLSPNTSPEQCKFTGKEHAANAEPVGSMHFSRPSLSAGCEHLRRAGGRPQGERRELVFPWGRGVGARVHNGCARRNPVGPPRSGAKIVASVGRAGTHRAARSTRAPARAARQRGRIAKRCCGCLTSVCGAQLGNPMGWPCPRLVQKWFRSGASVVLKWF